MSIKRLTTSAATFLCLYILITTPAPTPADASMPPASLQVGQKIQLACHSLPFQPIARKNGIDTQCGINGDTDDGAHQAQNRAKNNFCATGQPVNMTIARFVTLQQRAADKLRAANVKWGSRNNLPPDRKLLADLTPPPHNRSFGEGSLVTLVGFVIGARHSNVRKGESVNCTQPGAENNDIHIEVGESLPDDPCHTVTAEISPHFRPESWDQFDSFEITNPVRFTGPLFFDASHTPCTQSKRANPARISIWEIHPVYDIAVCKSPSLTVCRQNVNNANMWWQFDQWVNLPDNEDINQ